MGEELVVRHEQLTSGLFVAAMQITGPASFSLSNPSSSVRSWFKVCSLSSFPTLLSLESLPGTIVTSTPSTQVLIFFLLPITSSR